MSSEEAYWYLINACPVPAFSMPDDADSSESPQEADVE